MNLKYIKVSLFEISYKFTFSPYHFFFDVPVCVYIYIYIYIYCFVSQAIQEEQNGIPGFILQVLDHKKGLYLTCGGKKMQYSGTCFVICCLLKLLKWNYVPILQKNNEEQHLIQNITVYSFYIELQYYV